MRVSRSVAAAIMLAILPCTAFAAAPPPPQLPPAPPVGPEFHIANAVRIDAAEAPIIDGDLSDASWARAFVVFDFYQNSPDAFAPATERTEVRIMYDENNLYFGFYNYDSNPGEIIIGTMARDGNLFNSDNVRIALDPGATRRNGYHFQVSVAGGRRDAYIQNNTDMLVQWDAIWAAKTQLVEDGWIAEFAIPFRSLSYEPDRPEWGVEFSRSIRHKNENIRWSSYDPAVTDRDMTGTGTLTGISNVTQGLGLDVYVYGTGRVEHDWQAASDGTIAAATAGATVFYKVTPALTATLTNNPDFSDSPLDNRQVNTSRFSLFLPETRDFFLRDAGAFEFGGGNFGGNNARPFVTRSIGLARGTPVRIIAGGKLAGQVSGIEVGAVGAFTGDGPSSSGQFLSAARVAVPIMAQSKVGFIATHGDPRGESSNTLAGADFQYRTMVFDRKTFQSDFYYERTFSSTEGDDDSFGLALNYPNEPWSGAFQFKQVGTNFTPAMGFANRPAIRQYNVRVEHRTRYVGQFIQEMAFNANTNVVTDLGNDVESRDINASAFFETGANDIFTISVNSNYEVIPEEFDLPNDIPVAVGTYDWVNIGARIQTSNARMFQLTANANCCSFYNGRTVDLNFNLNFRPSQYFELRAGYNPQFIRMPNGSVDIHIVSADAFVNFTPDMQLAMEAQWDNISQDFAFSARYRWEYSPGNEVFAAFGQSAVIPGTRFVAQSSIFSVRLGRTFQF